MCDQEVMREPICCGQRHWLVTLSAVKRIVFVPAVAALLGFVGIPAARADLCHDGAMKRGAGSKPSGRAAGPVFSNRCLRALGVRVVANLVAR
jgi:hypothetical protein